MRQAGGGLVGSLPSLATATNLTYLLAGGNLLSGPLPELPPSAAEVYLDHNQFVGTIPLSYGRLPALRNLRLHGNALNGSIPEGFAAMEELQALDLGDNQLSGVLPVGWSTPALTALRLRGNSLLGELPPSLAVQPLLGYLNLQVVRFTTAQDYTFLQSDAAAMKACSCASLQANRHSCNFLGRKDLE